MAGEAPVFEIYFTDRPITDYRATLTADRALHAAFTRALLERGVVKAAQKFYVSLAHGEDDVQPHRPRSSPRRSQAGRRTDTLSRQGGPHHG